MLALILGYPLQAHGIHLFPIQGSMEDQTETYHGYRNTVLTKYYAAKNNPLIIHFIIDIKPWECRGIIAGEYWWKYVQFQDKSPK